MKSLRVLLRYTGFRVYAGIKPLSLILGLGLLAGCGFNYRQKVKVQEQIEKAEGKIRDCIASPTDHDDCFEALKRLEEAANHLWRMKDGRFGVRVP